MGLVVGLACKTYRNTGTYGTPVWNEITLARDVTMNLEKNVAEAVARASTWRKKLALIKDFNFDMNMLADTSIDDHDALRDAFLNDTIVDVALADGAIATTGTQYLRADVLITSFTKGQPLEDVSTVDVHADLAYSSNDPAFTTVGS